MLAQVLIAREENEEALKALLVSLQTLTQMGAAPDAQAVAGILAGWRADMGAEPFDALWNKVAGQPLPDWLKGQGMTPEQFIAQAIGAARERRPEAEQFFAVCERLAGDPNAPAGLRALGAALRRILSGDADVDLSALPAAWADAIRAALDA